MRTLLAVIMAAGMAGCSSSASQDSIKEVDANVQQLEITAGESRTLSSLAKIEESLANYIETEKKIPATLDVLIPKYLAAMPTVEIHVRGHHDTDKVQIYPSTILRDGQIDGAQLRDTGRWGYVFNDHQVIVFVDCTHRSSRGESWYLQRGVY